MAELAPAPMTAEFFLDWAQFQEGRFELVDGVPRMMAGASERHDQIVLNILALLRTQLRGTGCRPFTADFAVQTGPRQIRRPDAGVNCSPPRDDAFRAMAPRLVVEVLSPSTREFDMFGKVEEYKAVAGLEAILLIEPNAPDISAWFRRADEPWRHHAFQGLGSTIDVPGLNLRLPLAEIYEGLDFRPRPRLVPEDDPGPA